ncbi:hypothetical protein D3C86_1700850 [compost metagenome]
MSRVHGGTIETRLDLATQQRLGYVDSTLVADQPQFETPISGEAFHGRLGHDRGDAHGHLVGMCFRKAHELLERLCWQGVVSDPEHRNSRDLADGREVLLRVVR